MWTIKFCRTYFNESSVPLHNEKGFTLIELLMTILVAGILIGSLSVVVNNNSYISKRGRSLTVVNAYAENKVEEIRSKGYLSLQNGTTNISSELPPELAAPKSASLVIADTSVTGLKLVTVSISYNDVGTQKTQTYKTYIGELGVAQY